MANDLKEFNEVVKKCKILLLDIEGTTTSISFVKDKLFPYAEENVKNFLDSQWETEDVKDAVNALRKLALEDQEKSVEGVVVIPGEDASKEDQIEGLVNNVKWQMSSDRKVAPLKQLQGLIWKQGYDNGDIKGHVYDDVMPALEQWRSGDGQKVYIYSSGSVQAQKLLFGQSLAGDLLKFIDGHFDTAVGGKQEEASYKAIVEQIGCAADEILFLTDIVKEAEAARSAGLNAALVSREGNAPIPEEASKNFAVIQTFSQLSVSNKRKTDPQDEQPAKVPKTDIKDDVKSTPTQEKDETPCASEVVEEKMEVDPTVEEANVDTVIEEITDAKEDDLPTCETEPIVTEENNENEKQTNDVMETDNANNSKPTEVSSTEGLKEKVEASNGEGKNLEETADVPNEQVQEESGPIAEETPPAVITEIEDITNEQESLADVAEIIEGLVPVVEEPTIASDMEVLQNVGEELEKECDEILSKMNNVANMETIQVKPLLKPIIEEEPMESEGDVPSDIIDNVLKAEVEMESSEKPSETECEKTKEKEPVQEVAPESQIVKGTEIESTEAKEEITNGNTDESNIVSNEKTNETEKVVSEAQNNAVSDTAPTETTETVSTEMQKPENELPETNKTECKEIESKPEVQLNGDTTNGKPDVIANGIDKDDEIKSRLSAENGKEVNGSNGTTESENGQGDSKVEKEETSDIKVKTLAAEEPRPDPIEQATEA